MKDDLSPFSKPKGKKFLPMPSAHSSKSVKRYVHVVDMCAWVYVYVCMYNIICMYVIVITYLQVPYADGIYYYCDDIRPEGVVSSQ